MSAIVQENWIFFVFALLLGIGVAWWVLVASRRTKVGFKSTDTLDEGAGPALRNQALIDAPPAAASKPAETKPAPAPAVAPARAKPASSGDDLTRIKGLGPKISAMLTGMGITSFAQIAAWDEAEIDRVDAMLDKFKGRIRRDNWVEQAKFLAKGDTAGYEGTFGKL